VDQKPYSCEHVVPIDQEPRHHLVIENEFVRAFAVEIAPHDRTLCHRHPHDYLLYVVGDGDIVSAARDEEPKTLSYRDGECELLEAGLVHVVENLRDTPFRNVVVELLPGVGALRRGADPKVTAGEASITQVFDDDRAAIFSIEIAPGAEVESAGPAVMATFDGYDLNPDATVHVSVKHNAICDLGWVSQEGTATLWGSRKNAETAIVFQLGCTDRSSR
jgi:quercetin dioxygenase-like cupin family protein